MHNDNKIIKALECCIHDDEGTKERPCQDCPLLRDDACSSSLRKLSLDLIKRQKQQLADERATAEIAAETISRQDSEIERLKEDFDFNIKLNGLLQEQRDGRDEQIIELDEQIDKLNRALQTAKSEAIKEFAERLLNGEYGQYDWEYKEVVYTQSDIDNLVKEMVGDDNA